MFRNAFCYCLLGFYYAWIFKVQRLYYWSSFFWLFNVQASLWLFNIQGSEHICGEVLTANPPLPLSHSDGPYPGSFLRKGMFYEISTYQKKLWDILDFLCLFNLYMHLVILIFTVQFFNFLQCTLINFLLQINAEFLIAVGLTKTLIFLGKKNMEYQIISKGLCHEINLAIVGRASWPE